MQKIKIFNFSDFLDFFILNKYPQQEIYWRLGLASEQAPQLGVAVSDVFSETNRKYWLVLIFRSRLYA